MNPPLLPDDELDIPPTMAPTIKIMLPQKIYGWAVSKKDFCT